MASTFGGMSLFNSGPHRFVERSAGRVYLPPLQFDDLTDVTVVFPSPLELAVEQRGRLIGADESDLWAQIDAIRAETDAARTGTLVDNSGRSRADMTLLRFRPSDRIDRGRVVSVAYEAVYIRLASGAP